jgi:ABC-2 type transport system permease protein
VTPHTTLTPPPAEVADRAGLRQAIAGEWTKIRTLRSTLHTLAAVAAITVGTAVLVAATNSLQPQESVLAGTLGNAAVGQIAAGIFGVLVVTTEYASGSIHATLAAIPRRLVVLSAKTAVAAFLVFVVALAAAIGAHRAAAAILDEPGRSADAPIAALLGIALSYTAVAVLGVALGTALRHTAAATGCVIALLILPVLIGPMLGRWQPWIAGTTPAGALQKLAGNADAASALGALGAWPTLWIVCGYATAALAGSAWLLHRRDA